MAKKMKAVQAVAPNAPFAVVELDVRDPEGLKKLGGADVILATAPHSDATAATVRGLKSRGKLLLVAIPCGSAIDSEDSEDSEDTEDPMLFSVQTGVRPQVEPFRFRAVVLPRG